MPTLHIHAGVHKTGTTSLQKTLFDNRAHLKAHGVLYPETGLSQLPSNWGHHDLAYAMRHAQQGQSMWAALRAEADAAGLPDVVVSSEELSLLPFPSLPGLNSYKIIKQCFDGYDIRLICYLRPQAEMVASLYNHNVKAAGETEDIMDFLIRCAKRLDYAYYLNVAATVLGPEAIVVRKYQKTHMKGDTVEDFAAQIELAESVLPSAPQTLNSGLTEAGLHEMLAANRKYANNPMFLKAKRLEIIHLNKANTFESASLLSKDAQRTITALHTIANRQIAIRYLGFDGDLFDPLDF